jgi:predicted ATP-grasp superfamily ATP-dependent carboligase
VPASFGLAEAAGTDGAWRLYAALTELPLGRQPDPVQGRKVMLPQKDLQAAVARIRRRETTPAAVLRSWRGVRDTAAWSWRDPAPALAQVRSIIAGRRARKVR